MFVSDPRISRRACLCVFLIIIFFILKSDRMLADTYLVSQVNRGRVESFGGGTELRMRVSRPTVQQKNAK